MPRAPAILLVTVLLGGCDGLTCWKTPHEGDSQAMEYVGDRRCFRLSAPRKVAGLWATGTEYSVFYEGVDDPAELDGAQSAWLNYFELLRGERDRPSRGFYRVELIGRTPLLSVRRLVAGSDGQGGVFDSLVVADEIIRVEYVGPRIEPGY